jgi:hypothetical protein
MGMNANAPATLRRNHVGIAAIESDNYPSHKRFLYGAGRATTHAQVSHILRPAYGVD